MQTHIPTILALVVILAPLCLFLAARARRRVPPQVVERHAAEGEVTTTHGATHRDGDTVLARAYGMSDGILYTSAGRFRRHESRPGVWVCVHDARRHFTFGRSDASARHGL